MEIIELNALVFFLILHFPFVCSVSDGFTLQNKTRLINKSEPRAPLVSNIFRVFFSLICFVTLIWQAAIRVEHEVYIYILFPVRHLSGPGYIHRCLMSFVHRNGITSGSVPAAALLQKREAWSLQPPVSQDGTDEHFPPPKRGSQNLDLSSMEGQMNWSSKWSWLQVPFFEFAR